MVWPLESHEKRFCYCFIVLFKFVHLCSDVISNYQHKYTLKYYSVTPLSTVLLLLSSNTVTSPLCI